LILLFVVIDLKAKPRKKVVASVKVIKIGFFIIVKFKFSRILLGVALRLPLTIGLCDVGGFENLPPGTAAQLKYRK
jgi:hypothetical protein